MLILGSGTNASAAANRSLQLASAAVYSSLGKLSSGSRTLSTSEDAAGLGVQLKLVAAFNRLGALESNLLNALSFKQVQEESLKQVGDLLGRMSELKTLSLDSTKSASDLANYAQEYSALASEIRKTNERTFNGIRLFSDTSIDASSSLVTSEDGSRTMALSVPSMQIPALTDVACDKTYEVVSGSLEWSAAEADAVSRGGHLAQFKVSTDWEQALFQLGSALTAAPLWIGLKQAAGSSSAGSGWKWVTGESLAAQTTAIHWSGGQPDNGGNPEASSPASADALVWNQPATQCATAGHLGDEDASNADGVVSGYVIQYSDSVGATQYKAVKSSPNTWDQARLAAYSPAGGVLPANTAQTITGYSTDGSSLLTLTSTTTAGLRVGMSMSDSTLIPALIPAGATILAINSPTTVTLSVACPLTSSTIVGNLVAVVPQNPRLATLKTESEYAAAKAQLEAQGVGVNEVLWLGGYQAPPGVEADPAADWHWVASVQAGDSLVDPTTDSTMSWGASSHAGQPDNLSSSAVGKNVAYQSGVSGGWSDSSENPNQGSTTVSGYLLQRDTLRAITQDKINSALQWVSTARAQCGSEMSRIQFDMAGVQSSQVNLDAARSRISDVDVAAEAGRLSRSQVLLQAAASSLAQANAGSQIVLRLLA